MATDESVPKIEEYDPIEVEVEWVEERKDPDALVGEEVEDNLGLDYSRVQIDVIGIDELDDDDDDDDPDYEGEDDA